MRLSDWFTVISILLAAIAFIPHEERNILLFKVSRRSRYATLIVLFGVLPFLIFYENLSEEIPFLNSKPFLWRNGFFPQPHTWAFIIFFIFILYWVWWFSIKIKNVKPTKELINYYLSCLDTMPFEVLFRLFIKYEEKQFKSEEDFEYYNKLLSNQRFFKHAINSNPELYLRLILDVDIQLLLDSRIPVIIKDKINGVIAQQRILGISSVYNYEPVLHHNWPQEDLLLFHLYDCYCKLMGKCIDKNVFISSRSNFTMKNFFMETIFRGTLKSITPPKDLNIDKEEPTYFHKLLSSILSNLNHWIYSLFSKGLKQEGVDIFLLQYVRCMNELLKSNKDIISDYYLKIQFTSLMSLYFENNELKIRNSEMIFVRRRIGETLLLLITHNKNIKLKEYLKYRFSACWEHAKNDLWVHHSMPEITKIFEEKVVVRIKKS